jgi:hypothetical protein
MDRTFRLPVCGAGKLRPTGSGTGRGGGHMAIDLSTVDDGSLKRWIQSKAEYADAITAGQVPQFEIAFGSILGNRYEHITTVEADVVVLDNVQALRETNLDSFLRFQGAEEQLTQKLLKTIRDEVADDFVAYIGDIASGLQAYKRVPSAILIAKVPLFSEPPHNPLYPPIYKTAALRPDEVLFLDQGSRGRFMFEPLAYVKDNGSNRELTLKVGIGKPSGQEKLKAASFTVY